jgi:uncharacterized protein (DUF1697 family)
MRWAALLKGINIGGKKIPMTDLKAIGRGMGITDVKTLLASGNVVFDSGETEREQTRAHLEARWTSDLGLKTDVVVRNQRRAGGKVAANPFPDAAKDHPSLAGVSFHRDPVPRTG